VDHASLLALFRRIVLSGPPLILAAGLNAGCSQFDPCKNVPSEATATVAVNRLDAGSADASIDDLVARCQASAADCTPLCKEAMAHEHDYTDQPYKSCGLTTADGQLSVRVVYAFVCAGGRCPEGLVRPAGGGAGDTLGAWLAANAHLEAASVDAFEILAAELGAHRAPAALIHAARAAIADERRHAAVVGRLAVRRGALPPAVEVNRRPVRELEALATENAVEGCVRETYAALLAFRQARAATDPEIRAAMTGIARDEARHAALAWAVDGWSRGLLAPAARRRVRDARHEAIEQLLGAPPPTMTVAGRAEAGLPDEEEGARMIGALGAQLA